MIKLIMKVECDVGVVGENVDVWVRSFVSKVQDFWDAVMVGNQIGSSRRCDHSGYAQPQREEGNTQGAARALDRK